MDQGKSKSRKQGKFILTCHQARAPFTVSLDSSA